jgi:hypothetical protein
VSTQPTNETTIRIDFADRSEAERAFPSIEILLGEMGQVGTLSMSSSSQPPSAADAGDVQRVVEVLTYIANLQKNLDGSSAEEAALTAESEAKKVLATARRLLDAPPGPTDARIEKLQAFKNWVHAYLDEHGVPHHPPGVHGAEGCRIGDRMDWLMERLRKAEADAPPWVGERMQPSSGRTRIATKALEEIANNDSLASGYLKSIAAKALCEFALAAPAPAEGARAKAEACETVGPRNITTPPRWDEYDTYRLAGGNLGYDEWLAASAPAGGVATGEGGE